MNEGSPIAFEVLEDGVAVYASDGVQVGTVAHVIAEEKEDIFHGLLVSMPNHGVRFVDADKVASLHEFGVDLRIDSTAASSLPQPEHRAPVYDAEDPAVARGWHHWVRKAALKGDWNRER